MKLKIFKKFFVTTACILFVTLTLLFVIMSFVVNSAISDNKRTLLTDSANSISELIEEEALKSSVLLSIQTMGKVNELEIFIFDKSGNIILCSCSDYKAENECIHSEYPLDTEYLSGIGEEASFSLSTMNNRFESYKYIVSKRANSHESQESVYIFVTTSTVTVMKMLKLLSRIYAFSAVFPILLMFVAEYIITYRFTRPLKYMSVAARSIANGDFSKRIPIISDDEIGELSVMFNRMTDSLSRTEQVRRSFISNISHELKTPMTTISGFIDGIIDGTIEESKQQYYLKIVSDEVKRLSRLVQSMLSIARLESDERGINPTEFDFAELVLTIVVSMEQRITKKKLKIEGLENLSHTIINADKDLIYQVIYNLVDNAVKYSTEEGSISFDSHRISNRYIFKIKNEGNGIRQEDIPYIFERFYKTDKSRTDSKNSLGLGLYIAKTIVELHGGDISVNSDETRFTEFKLDLPTQFSPENKQNRR